MNEAIISECGHYRYVLRRKVPSILRWVSKITFVMLNPSTADANNDDPTIRRCIGFSKRNGFTDLSVVNLFAWRATNPKDLMMATDPVGPENDKYIISEVTSARLVVAAWGLGSPLNRKWLKNRIDHVRPILGSEAVCLGKTANGSPRHPLYIKSDQDWMEF